MYNSVNPNTGYHFFTAACTYSRRYFPCCNLLNLTSTHLLCAHVLCHILLSTDKLDLTDEFTLNGNQNTLKKTSVLGDRGEVPGLFCAVSSAFFFIVTVGYGHT